MIFKAGEYWATPAGLVVKITKIRYEIQWGVGGIAIMNIEKSSFYEVGDENREWWWNFKGGFDPSTTKKLRHDTNLIKKITKDTHPEYWL